MWMEMGLRTSSISMMEANHLSGSDVVRIIRMRRRIVAQYIRFTDQDGSTFLVEIDEEEVLSPGGIAKAGLKEAVGETVEKAVVAAQTLFEQAISNVIQNNAKA